ncbi:MAG TPA: hypothetical protein VIY52_31000 [Streptosporangiaceae bacterium]
MNRPLRWGEASRPAPRDDRTRTLASAQCSLCGIALPTGLMVPDGGQACTDIRWYCKDAQSCTERWTASLPRHPHIAPTPTSLAAPRETLAVGGEPRLAPLPDPVPADLLGASSEEAWSIDP